MSLTYQNPGYGGATAFAAPYAIIAPLEVQLTLPTLNTAAIDSAAGIMPGGKKTIYLAVTTLLTWVTSSQATWTPFISRNTFAAAGGATTQLGVNQIKLGSAQNLGASGTSLPVGLYRLSAATTADLQWPDPLLGVEFIFPSALTAGVMSLFVYVTP